MGRLNSNYVVAVSVADGMCGPAQDATAASWARLNLPRFRLAYWVGVYGGVHLILNESAAD